MRLVLSFVLQQLLPELLQLKLLQFVLPLVLQQLLPQLLRTGELLPASFVLPADDDLPAGHDLQLPSGDGIRADLQHELRADDDLQHLQLHPDLLDALLPADLQHLELLPADLQLLELQLHPLVLQLLQQLLAFVPQLLQLQLRLQALSWVWWTETYEAAGRNPRRFLFGASGMTRSVMVWRCQPASESEPGSDWPGESPGGGLDDRNF
jgi:hypothetical protein